MVCFGTFVTNSTQEAEALGKKISAYLVERELYSRSGAIIVGLSGELGAGKTTCVRGMAEGLGVEERILSPTYIIVRRIEIQKYFTVLYHIDAYNVDETQNVTELGMHEMIHSTGAIIAVEWPEKIQSELPGLHIMIDISFGDYGSHTYKIQKGDLL